MKQKFPTSRTFAEKRAQLESDGYVVIRAVCDAIFVTPFLKQLDRVLDLCAKEVGCAREAYLTAVSRWASPSAITHIFESPFSNLLFPYVEKFIGACTLEKTNVIAKTRHAGRAIPFHQDISYSPQNPYQLTAWVALTDVPAQAGSLVFVRGSHRAPLQSAVDFWSPDFTEKKQAPLDVPHVSVPLRAGDVLIFDARVWHGSSPNEIGCNRFALVTRWKGNTYTPPRDIPAIEKSAFGMWTCRGITEKILRDALTLFTGKSEDSFDQTIITWLRIFDCTDLPFSIDRESAKCALRNLYILHRGYTLHNGGDAQGTIYRNTWDSFLNPLNQHMIQITKA